jgi:hypothetical protein
VIYCSCQDIPEQEVITMRQINLLLILVLCTSLLAGCSSFIKASLDNHFTLAPGQSAHIASESMTIKFIGVTADSRCATGVECIRAGDVSCRVEITKDDIKNPITLTDTAGSGAAEGYTFQNYQFLFSVSPYPVAGITIAKSAYRLTLTVSKSGS